MRRVIVFLFAYTLTSGYAFAHSGDTLNVSKGTTPTIDGTISPGEWTDATVITFPGSGGITITCYVKHNGSDTLYIAQDMPSLDPGDKAFLWFDTQHNGGSAPQIDDYYIMNYYANSGEIEYGGTGSVWNSVTPSGWRSSFTGTMWTPQPGQMEFAIAFNKLNITAGTPKTIGFMIGFGEAPPQPQIGYWHWPDTGTNNYQNPNTWADMILSFTTGVTENTDQKNEISVYPNPSGGQIWVSIPSPKGTPSESGQVAVAYGSGSSSLEVYNVMGEKVAHLQLRPSGGQPQVASMAPWALDLSSQPSGVYFIQVKTDKELYTPAKMNLSGWQKLIISP